MIYHRSILVSVSVALVFAWPTTKAASPVLHAQTQQTAGNLWLAPDAREIGARQALARAVEDLSNGRAAEAAPVFQSATADPVIGGYALLFLGRAQLMQSRWTDALATARRLQSSSPTGYLGEASLWLMTDAATAAGEAGEAYRSMQKLAAGPTVESAALVQLRLGQTALDAGDRATGVRGLSAVYFENPVTTEAADAASALTKIGALPKASADTAGAFLARAERLFAGRQYTDARAVFDSIKTLVKGDDRDTVLLRLAECDFYLKRYAATLAALRTFPAKGPARAAEAEFFYISTLRETGRTADYFPRVRTFIDRNANPVYTERALSELAAFHASASEDKKAAEAYAELYRLFPQGPFSERAAWKSGWWAYKTGNYAEAARTFESASVAMRHADFRPAWLYWAARSHLRMRQTEAALAGFATSIDQYRNTYYGRASIREVERLRAATRPPTAGQVSPASFELPPTVVPSTRPDNGRLIQSLLAAAMYDEAILELRRIQATTGNTPMVEATIAFAMNRQGRLRPAIQTMRRAYPQFMEAGGEALPREILTVIFPVDHWSSIQQYAMDRNLDRFLVAALIAQESTFQANIKSSANAWGLMQILPSTGRQYAQRLGIRPFSTSRLTEPDTNLNIGTTFFAELMNRFGDAAPALAAYNAGASRAVKWLAERPNLDREEFIDDIPFAETQNYVKRILSTAEDYRRLYK